MEKAHYINAGAILLLAAILLAIIFAQPAAAFETETITNAIVTGKFELSPAMGDLELKHGDRVDKEFFVRNLTGRNLNLKIRTKHVIGSRSTANPWLETGYPTWIKHEIDHIALKNMQKLSFKIRIKVPKDAPPGDHIEMVYVQTVPSKNNPKGSAVKTVSRLAAVFYITIRGGKLHTKTDIESFATDKRFYNDGPVIFKFVLKNGGNIHGRLSGKIVVTNLLTHKRVGTVDVPGITIMANARKEITFKYPLYRPMGRYKAELLLTERFDKRKSRATVEFYGLPLSMIAAFLGGCAFLGLLVLVKRKYRIVRK